MVTSFPSCDLWEDWNLKVITAGTICLSGLCCRLFQVDPSDLAILSGFFGPAHGTCPQHLAVHSQSSSSFPSFCLPSACEIPLLLGLLTRHFWTQHWTLSPGLISCLSPALNQVLGNKLFHYLLLVFEWIMMCYAFLSVYI